MRTVGMYEANHIWEKFLNEAKKETFKVEVLQDYYAVDAGPSLDAWLAGNKQKSIDLIKQLGANEWQKSYKAKPINKIRVHIVEYPLSPYIEWELQVYRLSNIPFTDEKIYLADKSKLNEIKIPDGDFWIFDNEHVLQYHYRNTKPYEADVYDKKDNIKLFIELKNNLLQIVEPIAMSNNG